MNSGPASTSVCHTRSCRMTPPSGWYPLVTALANTSRSGVTFERWMPKAFPRRPKPVMTSSTTSSTSWRAQHAAGRPDPPRRRHDHAAHALHGLRDDGADPLGAFPRDQRFELVGAGERAAREGLAQLAAIAVRARDARHLRHLRLVVAVEAHEPGQARRPAR